MGGEGLNGGRQSREGGIHQSPPLGKTLDNTKCMDLAEDIEAAQCAIMANVVISSEAVPDLRPVPQV